MIIDWIDVLCAFSKGFDCVEQNICKVSSGHCMRVAYLCALAAKQDGLEKSKLVDIVACAILHDNALTQYLFEERINDFVPMEKLNNFGNHCIEGEENMKLLPFYDGYKDMVLYHHENANGSGIFGKKSGEIPFGAELIHVADSLDGALNPATKNVTVEDVKEYIETRLGTKFSEKSGNAIINIIDEKTLEILKKKSLIDDIKGLCNHYKIDVTGQQVKSIGKMFARIIDYKSPFTKMHSVGIAEKAERIGEYYNYDYETCCKLYLAGAIHDVGKLVIKPTVLEKEDRLTNEEYAHIQTHAEASLEILRGIEGLEDVTRWAVRHHEKLDGTGYPLRLSGDELVFNDRLLACIDIYQALTEDRPYRKNGGHQRAMTILNSMAEKGQLDETIVKDIHKVFGCEN